MGTRPTRQRPRYQVTDQGEDQPNEHCGVAASRRKALNDLGGATQIQRPVMLTIIRIFLAYWFGLSILFMILSLVMSGSAIIDAAVGLGFLMAIVLTLIQRWRR